MPATSHRGGPPVAKQLNNMFRKHETFAEKMWRCGQLPAAVAHARTPVVIQSCAVCRYRGVALVVAVPVGVLVPASVFTPLPPNQLHVLEVKVHALAACHKADPIACSERVDAAGCRIVLCSWVVLQCGCCWAE